MRCLLVLCTMVEITEAQGSSKHIEQYATLFCIQFIISFHFNLAQNRGQSTQIQYGCYKSRDKEQVNEY